MGFNIYLDANDTDKEETHPHDIIWLTYDPNEQTIEIEKGPNKSRKLVHRNIVREVRRFGEWKSGNLVVPLEVPRSADPRMDVVYLIQDGADGPIVAFKA